MTMTQPTSFNLSRWTRLTFFGWLLGIVLILLLSSLFDVIGLDDFQFFIGIGMGGGVGVFQFRYFRNSVGPGVMWLWYSLIGVAFPFLLNDLIFKLGEVPGTGYYLPISVVTGSIFVSILQFSILKNHFGRGSLWIIGGVISWTLAMGTVLSMDYLKEIITNRWAGFFINLSLILGGGVVLGISSGLFLRKIFRDHLNYI